MEGKEATLLINTIAGVFHSMSESALSAQIKDIIYSFVTDGLDDCPFCEERFTRFKFGVSMPFGAKNVLAEGHYIDAVSVRYAHYIKQQRKMQSRHGIVAMYGEKNNVSDTSTKRW